MALNISAGLVPTGGGSWETHDAIYGKGGYRAVADVTERDAISTLRRSAGMIVNTLATGAFYILGAGLGNGDWTQLQVSVSAGNGLTGTSVLSVLANGSSIEVSASGIRRAALSGAVSAAAGSNVTAFASGDFGALDVTTTGDYSWGAAATSPTIGQLATTTASGQQLTTFAQDTTFAGGTGGHRKDRAGNSTGASGTRLGGNATYTSGTGTTRHGQLFLSLGDGAVSILEAYPSGDPTANGETRIKSATSSVRIMPANVPAAIFGTSIFWNVAIVQWQADVVAPTFGQQAQGLGAPGTGSTQTWSGQDMGDTGGVTGGVAQRKGGDATGASGSRTGGNIYDRPGTGATANGNWGWFVQAADAVNFQSMQGGIYCKNRSAAPTGNPSGGGFLYADAGALIWRGSGGTVTTVAPA